MSVTRSHEVMRLHLEEVVGKGNLDVLEDIAAPDMVDHAAIKFGWRPGRDGWVDHVSVFRAALPDAEVTVQRIVASDDEVVGLWTATGTHSANFFGVEATGRRITGTAVSFFKLRDGKVTDYVAVVDQYPLLQQMGALPTPTQV
jgi:steroid delta-isomerase-like uncharacterized protein